MSTLDGSISPAKLEGKRAAMLVCWILGSGSLLSWNCILTIEDYYGFLFPQYHPSRVLSLVHQPFAVVTLAVLTYDEAKINTRKRNLFGDMLLSIGAFVQGGMIGDLSFLQAEFLQSFLAGLATSGTLISALRLITKAAFENSRYGLRKGASMLNCFLTCFDIKKKLKMKPPFLLHVC
ncbi:equilibrative nucleotide transporter 3-like [Hevea brasiliensis]|uniref:equilibrative nucleotide transporter 3-like n=1 Tax=Hevea brasiliensis TaxID=3981 RepID=UPI0025F0A7E7|nr:equilibrative nucleotide transporter 3-like [Hevea brasiliensis]